MTTNRPAQFYAFVIVGVTAVTILGCKQADGGSSSGISAVGQSDDCSTDTTHDFNHVTQGSGNGNETLTDAPPPEAMSAEEEAAYQKHQAEWKAKWESEGGFEGHHPNWENEDYHNESTTNETSTSEFSLQSAGSGASPCGSSASTTPQNAQPTDQTVGQQATSAHDQWYEENAETVAAWQAEHERLGLETNPDGSLKDWNAATSSTTAPAVEQDRDQDRVPDSRDQCAATPAGAPVWTYGKWTGCAQGQRLTQS